MGKKYSRIKRTDQSTSQTNYRKDLISSKDTLEQRLQISDHADMKLTESGKFLPKNAAKLAVLRSNHSWNLFANVFVPLQNGGTSNQNVTHR